MHPHAPIPAARPHLSLNAFSGTTLNCEERNGSGERPSSYRTLASRFELWLGRTSAAEKRESDFGPEGFIRLVSRLCTVTASGLNRRPAARRRSALSAPPFQGLGSSQNKFVNARQLRRTNFFRAPPRKHSLALGSRAHFAY
ncbi:hypothetical protein BH10ACI4_BH10ACI4_00060 [soil metagenome]